MPSEESARFVAALRRSRLCLRCASTKSDIVEERLVRVIGALQRLITVIESVEDCHSCDRRTIVYKFA